MGIYNLFYSFLDIYNEWFNLIIFGPICYLIFVGGRFYFNRDINYSKWNNLTLAIQNTVSDVLVSLLFIVIVYITLTKVLNIDVLFALNFDKTWRALVSIFMLNHVKLAIDRFKRYEHFDYRRYFRERYGDDRYILELKKEIIIYESYLTIEKEKFDYLKNIAPIPLVSLFAGFLLQGKHINIDWNSYTILFCFFIGYYCYRSYQSFRTIRSIVNKKLNIQIELNDVFANKI